MVLTHLILFFKGLGGADTPQTPPPSTGGIVWIPWETPADRHRRLWEQPEKLPAQEVDEQSAPLEPTQVTKLLAALLPPAFEPPVIFPFPSRIIAKGQLAPERDRMREAQMARIKADDEWLLLFE